MHNHLTARQGAIFLEVEISDASDFATTVQVTSAVVGAFHILRATGPPLCARGPGIRAGRRAAPISAIYL